MDHEKFPNYFLAVIVLYAVVLLVGLSYFILPSLSFGAAYADFMLIFALFFLPLILLAVYEFEKLPGKESALRTAITALVVVDLAIDLLLLIFLI